MITDIPSTPDDAPSGERRDDFSPGDVLDGRYRVESVLGSGGMGMVYRVTQMFVDKQFALKTIIKGQLSEVKIRRFQQEARAVFSLDHPNIVAVKDFGIIEEMTPFLVMELIDGENLSERLKRTGRLPLEEIIPIFVQTCFGLGYAHDQGIVHRDIKPSNIMLLNGIASGAEGSIKIVDFGIAKFAQSDGGDIQALTKTGEIFGSPFYMSPEQCTGERVDHRADVYSLGCVLFEALTGAPPCVGDNALSTMMQHQIAKLPSLKEASMGLEFPAELERIVAKMLEKNPENRYQKLGIVAHRLASLGQMSSQTIVPSDRTLEFSKAPVKVKVAESITLSKSKFFALVGITGLIVAMAAGIFGYFLGRDQSHGSTQSASNRVASKQDATTQDATTQDASIQVASKQDPLKLTYPDSKVSNKEQRVALPPPVLISSINPKPIPLGAREISGFSFPKNICVGILKVDNQLPKSVVGEKSVDRKSKLTFYTRHASKNVPSFLNKFRDDDLNGLECVFRKPEEVIEIVRKWKRLENLSFFDSVVKAMPGAESHDETPIVDELLPSVDKLTTLTSLGLCGRGVTGDSVAKMSLLRSLRAIKLKDIRNIEPLLKVLPQHNNIEEVWLINQGTDNRQLELLATMGNLKSLTIRRSRLEPDSLSIFLTMKKLKNLTLDRNNWSDEDKKKFKRAFPNCRFEPVIDVQYWFLLPDRPFLSLNSKTNTDDQKSAPKTSAIKASEPHLDISDSKGDFVLVDKFMQGKGGKFDIARVLVRPDDLEELGATPKEIHMIANYPFDQIEPHEREFDRRFEVELKKPTKWSHR
ncbi:hypothetical protein BH10CYA1_BH10CYA1_04380 [soil metagenome]